MLQQPVSRELRSFQSLSRFSGPRGLLSRRQSNSRRYLQSRRRTTEAYVGDSQVYHLSNNILILYSKHERKNPTK